MATIKALKSGNWSDPTVWSTGALPLSGDTVYANGFSVNIDQNVLIGSSNNFPVSAGSFVVGQYYTITAVGSTVWTSIGALSNTLGLRFLATGIGSGSGIANTVATITTLANAGITAAAGGAFSSVIASSLYFDCAAGTTMVLSLSGSVDNTVIGNIYGSNSVGIVGVSKSSSGNLILTGNVQPFSSGATPPASVVIYSGNMTMVGSILGLQLGTGINNVGTGVITITGNVVGGTQGGGSGSNYGIINTSSGTVNITGNVTGSLGAQDSGILNQNTGIINVTGIIRGGTSATAYGIHNNSTGIINVIGSVIGDVIPGIFTTTAGTIIVVGDVSAGISSNGISSSNVSAINRISGNIINAANGMQAIYAQRYSIVTVPTNMVVRQSLDGVGTYLNYYQDGAAISQSGQPQTSNVRYGTSYGPTATLTGTCRAPAAASTAYGVQTDTTTGTAVLTPSGLEIVVRSAFSIELGRQANCATVQTTAEILAGIM